MARRRCVGLLMAPPWFVWNSPHGRPDFADVGHQCTANLEPARSQLGDARTTGATQFTDLTSQRPPSEDVSDEEVPDPRTPSAGPVPEEKVPTPSQQATQPSTPRPIRLPECEAFPVSVDHRTVVPGAAENAFDQCEFSGTARSSSVFCAATQKKKTKSPPTVVVHGSASSSCLPGAQDNDVPLDSDEALPAHRVSHETLGFPLRWQFVEDSFFAGFSVRGRFHPWHGCAVLWLVYESYTIRAGKLLWQPREELAQRPSA